MNLERYWKLVYWSIRSIWSKNHDDAEDLTQAFFAWMIETEALKRYDPERGGLKAYLKIVLRSFVRDREIAARSLKRGGGRTFLTWEPWLEPVPEESEHRALRIDLVREALEKVRERYRASGKEAAYDVLSEYILEPGRRESTYVDLAARLGFTRREVHRHLTRFRSQVRSHVMGELA